MLYSKTGKFFSCDTEFQTIKKLKNIDYANPITFYHHPYDRLQHNVHLNESLDQQHWEYMKKNSHVKLIHDTSTETFEIFLVNDIVTTLTVHKINPGQLTIMVMDENHKQFLEVQLKKRGITGVDILVNNYLLKHIVIPSSYQLPIKKFSALSRNYRIWRLAIYAELCNLGLLNNFNYSFHNISPYVDNPVPETLDTMLTDLKKTEFGEVSDTVLEWLTHCPHNLTQTNNVRDKWENATYDTIQSANFHLLIETHYDQKEFFQSSPDYSRDFSPSSITEKAYKAIACTTPFIAFATPNWLADLRALGFKTYSPYINESYDTEVNNKKRLNMIVREIKRICSLDDRTYKELVRYCNIIALENLEILKKKINA
jgi:hypothetical protein